MSGWGQTSNRSTVSDVSRIQSAIRAAERGQTTDLFTLYRDYIAGGGHLGAELAKRKMALCAEALTLLPATKGNLADQRARDLCMKAIELCPTWNRDILWLLDSCFYPVSVAEKIFEPVNDFSSPVHLRWGIKELAGVDPLLLCFYIPYVATGGMAPAAPSSPVPISPSPAIPLGYNPAAIYNPDDWEAELRFWRTLPNGFIDYSWSNVYAPTRKDHLVHRGNFMTLPDNFGGPGRGCLFWQFYATMGRDWFAKAVEFFGQPIPTVEADLQNVDVLNELQQMFNEARKLRAFFVNTGSKIEFQETRTEQMAQAYNLYIELCHDEISKALVGQSLSSRAQSTGQGSGQAKLANDVRDDIRRFDQLMMGETLRKGLFTQLIEYNGESGQPPRLFWGGATEADVKLLSQALAQLAQAQIEATDDALDELSLRLGFRLQRTAPERIAMLGPHGDKAEVDAPPLKNGESKSKAKSASKKT